MKKNIIKVSTLLLILGLVTGCGCSKKEKEKEYKKNEKTVIKDNILEGLDFTNAGFTKNSINTLVINNTGVRYEGSKFSIKIMDADGNVIEEVIGEVKKSVENGKTLLVETKTKKDISKAVSVEYSIVK